MNNTRFGFCKLLTVCGCLLLVGCAGGNGNANKPKTVPVNGTVTLDGKPIAGALITFSPNDKSKHTFMGSTDAEGKYQLGEGSNVGAEPGSYKVAIDYYTKPGGEPVAITPETDLEFMQKQGEVVQSLPPQYNDREKTELKADVVEGKENVINFDLKKG